MPVIKVWNFDRSQKKIIQADSLEKIRKEGGLLKLGYDMNVKLKVVFENDGTDIDSEEILQALVKEKIFPETVLMIMPEHFIWRPPNSPGTSQQSMEIATEHESVTPAIVNTVNIKQINLLDSHAFLVPWEQFPKNLLSVCEANKVPELCLVRKMIRIVAEAIIKYKSFPERSFIRLVAQAIVNKYPVLANPTTSGTNHNFETIFTKLEHCVQNLRRPSKFSQQNLIESKEVKNKKDEYGCVQWQPMLPSDETPSSQEKKRMWLVEAQRTSSTEVENISQEMNSTYFTQRLDINSKASIKIIKERWPYLFQERYFFQHSDKLMGIEILSVWNKSIEKVHNLISYFRSLRRKNEAIDNVLLKLEEDVALHKSLMPEVSYLLTMLCTYFGEKETQVIKYFEAATSLSVIENVRKTENIMNPSICILGDSLSNSKGYIFLEDTVIGDLAKMSDLLPLFFTTFYVFNICYPMEVEASLEFLQREFFNINPSGHKRGGKKKRTVVHPKVLTLQYNLQHFNSMWGQSTINSYEM